MRERGRERDSENRVPVRKVDFRANLVSIFVDNLNPVVDQKGLWGIFKPFGLVRDIHLSPKLRNRRSCYAFVRFATLEEAEHVARITNGMHVYGWPITSKVANIDWNKRKKDDVNQQKQTQKEVKMPSGFFRENGGSSFAEVVRNVHSMKEVSESKMYQKVEVMYWDGEGNDTRWLEYSVVGVLKTFTDVSLVVKTLLDSQVFF